MTKEQRIKIAFSIGEPWGFNIPGRGNQFSGITSGICLPPQKKNWGEGYLLVNIDENFEWKGDVVSQVLISTRYAGDTINDIYDGKQMTVGIARVRPGNILEPGQQFTVDQIEYFAIGSAQRL